MLKHQRQALLERTRKRVERAERQRLKAASIKTVLTPSDRLKSVRAELHGLTPQIIVAIEVLLLQGKSVKSVARELGASADDVQAILSRLSIVAANRKVDYIAARLSSGAPDPLPRLSKIAASHVPLPTRRQSPTGDTRT